MSVAGEDEGFRYRVRNVFFVYATLALSFCMLTAFSYVKRGAIHNLFDLPFYVGETAWNLIKGSGLSLRTYPLPNQLVVMHAARMPVATLYAAAAILTLGPFQVMLATLIKSALLLLPVLGAARMVFHAVGTSKRLLLAAAATLALPFFVPGVLADVVNLQVEEGYAYAFLAISFTLVALGPRQPTEFKPLLVSTLATGAALDLLYLSKSSMILVVAVLLACSLLRNGARWSRVLLLLMVVAAPLGWAIRQHAVSGRYAVGTSLDGGNFHKGNFEQFLAHYPPVDGGNLDFYDQDIAPPQPLGGEWAYNDWHNRAAVQFIRSHPRETLVGWEKKVYVYLFALHVYGNGSVAAPGPVTLVGMVLFRLLLWGALGLSVVALFRGRQREIALLYLATVAACTAPYLVGFGYTRHASVLVYPSAVAICLLCAGWSRTPALPAR